MQGTERKKSARQPTNGVTGSSEGLATDFGSNAEMAARLNGQETAGPMEVDVHSATRVAIPQEVGEEGLEPTYHYELILQRGSKRGVEVANKVDDGSGTGEGRITRVYPFRSKVYWMSTSKPPKTLVIHLGTTWTQEEYERAEKDRDAQRNREDAEREDRENFEGEYSESNRR